MNASSWEVWFTSKLSSLLCIPRKMDDDTPNSFKKRYVYIEHSSYHSFQLNWVTQNIFAFVGHNNTGELVEMWIRVKKFLAAQFVQNQNVNTVKTCLVFPTIDRNAEILSGGFNDCFSCCWVYWLLVNFWLPVKFLSNRARESRFF